MVRVKIGPVGRVETVVAAPLHPLIADAEVMSSRRLRASFVRCESRPGSAFERRVPAKGRISRLRVMDHRGCELRGRSWPVPVGVWMVRDMGVGPDPAATEVGAKAVVMPDGTAATARLTVAGRVAPPVGLTEKVKIVVPRGR